MDKVKNRTSYPKELKAAAKAEGKGLMTVQVQLPNGETHEVQCVVDAMEAAFIRWSAACIRNRGSRPLPDLENFVKEHLGL